MPGPVDTFVRKPDLIAAEMDGDLVMMSVERGEYFGVGGIGARVWELLAQPTTVAEIARTICAEYDVDEARCLADMQAFVDALVQNGLATTG